MYLLRKRAYSLFFGLKSHLYLNQNNNIQDISYNQVKSFISVYFSRFYSKKREFDLPAIFCYMRPPELSKKNVEEIRKKYYMTPGWICGLPDDPPERLIAIRTREFHYDLEYYGHDGYFARIFQMHLMDENGLEKIYRVLPKTIRYHPDTLKATNITYMYAPLGKIVKVEVPVKVIGDDVSPGVKKGGYPLPMMYRLKIRCKTEDVPSHIPLDVTHLDVNDKIWARDIDMPPNTEFIRTTGDVCLLKIKGPKY